MQRIVIMGAGGRDFHDFLTVFRDDPEVEVVAFTAAEIPGIDDRRFPASLAGARYPHGIQIRPESELTALIRHEHVDEVVLSYSDLAHETVMHKASLVLAAGASFRMLSPAVTMLQSHLPVVAVCAARTGCGKSQTSRYVGRLLMDAGLRVALVRHPMPYGDLEAMRVQCFHTLADIDASHPTIEEREEYEEPVRAGMVMYAGVDYAEILRQAERHADVIIWDGGNNDTPFYRPDVHICVVDPLRPGHEVSYHPGETNLRMAQVVVLNKIDSATKEEVQTVVANIRRSNPGAMLVKTMSPVVLEREEEVAHRRVLVVEDGPTLTHGGMPYGAGTVAAHHAGVAEMIDPRPYAVGSLVDTFANNPHLGPVLPAMGYGDQQLADLVATIDAIPCDAVILGTPIDLTRFVSVKHPVYRARYELQEIGEPTLATALRPLIEMVHD